MAPVTKLDPNELLSVVWAATGDKVQIPRRLVTTGSRAAQERYLIGSGQIPDPSAPPLPAMDTPAQLQQATIDAAALATVEARLSRLESAPTPELPTPDRVEQLIVSAMRAGVSKEEIVVVADQAVSRIEGVAGSFESRLAEADAREQALSATISDALANAQQSVAGSVLGLEQSTAAALSSIEQEALATAAEIARQQIGPTGAAGSSTVLSLEDPLEIDSDNFAQRWLGRGLIDGDGVLVIKPDQILVRRWVGGTWREGPAIQPKVVREDIKASVLNTGNNVISVSAGAGGGGGGSFAADPIFLSGTNVTPNTAVSIADSSRWQVGGNGSFRSGIIAVEIVPLDGPNAGQTNFVEVSFIVLAGGAGDAFRFSEGYALGNAISGGGLSVDFSGAMSAATAPGSLPMTVPPGTANATRLFMTINAPTPPTGASRYLVRGRVEWTPDAATGVAPINQIPLKTPSWQLV
jgi:hypothetical protein